MEARLKAEELVNKYHKDYDLLFWDLSWIQAKQCALIAVDELIDENEYLEEIVQAGLKKQFWEKVKQEIENL